VVLGGALRNVQRGGRLFCRVSRRNVAKNLRLAGREMHAAESCRRIATRNPPIFQGPDDFTDTADPPLRAGSAAWNGYRLSVRTM
jgi:hypothetical protein